MVGASQSLASPVSPSPLEPGVGVASLVQASASVFRETSDAVRDPGPLRDLFIGLCHDQGIRSTEAIAHRCHASRRV